MSETNSTSNTQSGPEIDLGAFYVLISKGTYRYMVIPPPFKLSDTIFCSMIKELQSANCDNIFINDQFVLVYAARWGYVESVKYLLHQLGQNTMSCQTMYTAIKYGKIEIVKLICHTFGPVIVNQNIVRSAKQCRGGCEKKHNAACDS